MIDNERHSQPQQLGGGWRVVLACALWAAWFLSVLQLSVRKWRGSRADPLWVKLVAISLFPLLVAAGGGWAGSDGRLLFLSAWAFLGFAALVAQGEKLAAKRGEELSSRFVGYPIPVVIFPWLGRAAYLIEPLGWLLIAGLCALIKQPGLAVALAAGAVCMPAEILIVMRRDATLAQDTKDARAEAKRMAAHIDEEGW